MSLITTLFISITSVFFIFFPGEKITYYSFQGVTVTRIDGNGESIFFYGKVNADTSGHPCIKAKHFGHHNDLNVALNFRKDGLVEIINLGGEAITTSGARHKIFFAEYSHDTTDWEKLLSQPNVVRASTSLDYERVTNAFYKSEVLVEKKD